MAHIIIVPQQPGYDEVFRSRGGIVGRDLNRRAGRVEAAARGQAGSDTGRLKRDIDKEWVNTTGDILTMRVGASVSHALMHHQGTRQHVIRPTRDKAMRFVNEQGDVVFARVVHHPGTKPNRFLTDNLHLAVE